MAGLAPLPICLAHVQEVQERHQAEVTARQQRLAQLQGEQERRNAQVFSQGETARTRLLTEGNLQMQRHVQEGLDFARAVHAVTSRSLAARAERMDVSSCFLQMGREE